MSANSLYSIFYIKLTTNISGDASPENSRVTRKKILMKTNKKMMNRKQIKKKKKEKQMMIHMIVTTKEKMLTYQIYLLQLSSF